MNLTPLVSIIIPLYNGANYVEEALKCAINQTYPNVEIIVVNDGSTDNGAGKNICDKYKDKIRYFEKENGGCSSSLNYGIKKAEGKYISWLSHDDLYDLDKIEKQISLYEKEGLDIEKTIISSQGQLIDSQGEKIYHPTKKTQGFLKSNEAFKHILFGGCPNGCGLLIPKAMFDEYGYFDETLRFVLDWNLWLKFALHGAGFFISGEPLVYNRVHSMQVTVKQKELHKKEASITVDQLFKIISAGNYDEDLIRNLYYFSYSSKRGDTKAIRSYLREHKVKYSKLFARKKRIKTSFVRFLKKIYHKLRR